VDKGAMDKKREEYENSPKKQTKYNNQKIVNLKP
jgi:hypothetical protein